MADLRLGKALCWGFSPLSQHGQQVSCYLQRCSTTAFAYVSERNQLPRLLGGQIPQGLGLMCSEDHPPDQPHREMEGSQVFLSHTSFAVRWVQRHAALKGCTMLRPETLAGRRKGYLGLLSLVGLNLSKWWIYTASSSYLMWMWIRGSTPKT